MAIFVAIAADLRPFGRAGRLDGGGMNPRLDPLDQIELPGAALDLPGPEPDEDDEDQQRAEAKQNKT